MTIVPRTGPLSASSALATTSWYQRGKSSDWGVSTVLAMPSILGSVWTGTRAVKRSTPGLGVLHGGDQKGLPRLPRVGELARPTGLLEYACGGVSGHVVEVAADRDIGATPDMAAHGLDRLHLGVGSADEAWLLRPEPADVAGDVVAVRGVEEIGQHVGELMGHPCRGAPVEGQATAQRRGRGVAPLVVPQ